MKRLIVAAVVFLLFLSACGPIILPTHVIKQACIGTCWRIFQISSKLLGVLS